MPLHYPVHTSACIDLGYPAGTSCDCTLVLPGTSTTYDICIMVEYVESIRPDICITAGRAFDEVQACYTVAREDGVRRAADLAAHVLGDIPFQQAFNVLRHESAFHGKSLVPVDRSRRAQILRRETVVSRVQGCPSGA